MSKTKVGEWLWRFLAVVMMFSVGWTVWIIYQLNPPPLIMNAALEAAAQAKVKEVPADKQRPEGAMAASSAAEAVPSAAAASAPAEAPKEPPINPDKLKFSETIAIPVPPAKK